MATLLIDAAALALGATAAVWDARTGRIPNRLVLPAAALGLAVHAASGGMAGALRSASGFFLAALVPWALYRMTQGRAIGGGDVKLFAALGALRGPVSGLEIELAACVLLGSFALFRLAFAGRLFAVLSNACGLLLNPLLPARFRRPILPETLTAMRMGPAIAAAVGYGCLADHAPGWLTWLL